MFGVFISRFPYAPSTQVKSSDMMKRTFGLRAGSAIAIEEMMQKQIAKLAMDFRKVFMRVKFLLGKKIFSERKLRPKSETKL
jgi:hypothetical protein